MKYTRCPECGKKGAYIKLGRQDAWRCRYCAWYALTDDVFDCRSGRWTWEA